MFPELFRQRLRFYVPLDRFLSIVTENLRMIQFLNLGTYNG